MRGLLILLSGLCALMSADVVMASGCDWNEVGYVYVYESCVQEEVGYRQPQGPCEVAVGEETKIVYVVSNVITDDGSNDIYPSGHFYDEALLKWELSTTPKVSLCYGSREEAEHARRQDMAGWSRGWHGAAFVELRLNDT